VVFLRGVNVGGARAFRPSALARELDLVSIGAAGTFVARRPAGAALRTEIARRLPFEAEVMVCPADEIAALVREPPFGRTPPTKDLKWFITILEKSPAVPVRLPLEQPAGADWQVRVVAVQDRYAFSLWRRQGARLIYPNEVIEKRFGVAATTRGWNTLTSIVETLAPTAPRKRAR
jgi:uncharacterized protein (DUF1697 family)